MNEIRGAIPRTGCGTMIVLAFVVYLLCLKVFTLGVILTIIITFIAILVMIYLD